ncbi:MAG TPA: J domain-containing protein [Spirochaetia bacterium]|nr:J domain-containing protein [Spirochaetia bacterium]
MSDSYFREILGVPADATREQIRQSYRQRVMENHPDRFPPERKHLQELATITLTEAYGALMSGALQRMGAEEAAPRPSPAPPRQAAVTPAAAGSPRQAGAAPAPAAAIALPRDPAYAYYKQGFINFSLAIHGIAAVNRKIAAGRSIPTRRRFNTAEYFGTCLSYLRAAHGYFTRVAEEYPESVWTADARFKLRRIEGLTAIYRRILGNMRARWAPGARPGSHEKKVERT